MTPIIIVCGTAGSGKGTAANIIRDKYGAACIALADPLKCMVRDFFPFHDDSLFGESHRRADVLNKRLAKPLPTKRMGAIIRKWFDRLLIEDEEEYNITEWYFSCLAKAESGKLTARYALQTLGTDWGRSYKHDLWYKVAKTSALKLLGGGYSYDSKDGSPKVDKTNIGYDWVVITDGRFRNEILSVTKSGGVAVMIKRDVKKIHEQHQSEREITKIPEHYFRYIVNNSGSKESFEKKIKKLMADVMQVTHL